MKINFLSNWRILFDTLKFFFSLSVFLLFCVARCMLNDFYCAVEIVDFILMGFLVQFIDLTLLDFEMLNLMVSIQFEFVSVSMHSLSSNPNLNSQVHFLKKGPQINFIINLFCKKSHEKDNRIENEKEANPY